jgi:deoxyribose-phosphate aldolase
MATQPNRLVAVPTGTRHDAHEDRNPGVPLDLDWVSSVRVNRSAVERRASTLPAGAPSRSSGRPRGSCAPSP